MATMLSDERFRAHRIHELLNRLQEAFDSVSKEGWEESPEGSQVAIRLALFIPYTVQRLGGTITQLAAQEDLDSIAAPCDQILTALKAMTSENAATHWQTVDQNMGPALRHLARLPVAEQPADLTALAGGVDNARRKISGTLAAISRQAKDLRTELQQLRDSTKKATGAAVSSQEQVEEKADGIQKRLDTLIVDLQTKFTEAQTANAERFQVEVDKRAEAARLALAAFEKEAKDALETAEEELGKFQEGLNEATEKLKNAFSDEAKGLIGELTKQKDEAVRLVEVIGSTGMTGAYQKQAKWSRWERYVWSSIAVGAFVSLVWIVLSEFDAGSSIDWPVVAVRALISATLLGLAGFAGVESKRAGDAERRYRRIELELASIGPYLADFPEAERLRIKEELLSRIIGEASTSEAGNTPVNASLVKQVVSAMEKVPRKKPE